jgi:small-conductance mechanosensitive channel
MFRRLILPLCVVCLLLCMSVSPAQTPPVAKPTPASAAVTGRVQPETVAARKAQVQEQLKALADSERPKEVVEAERKPLEQLLTVLTALEEAEQKRATYTANLKALPQRLRKLEEEQKTLEAQPPRRFPKVTEQLRDQYQSRLQATQEEIEQLTKDTAAGEVRLSAIPKELEQRASERSQLEKDLLAERAKATETDTQTPVTEIESLEWRLQMLQAQMQTLRLEQEWLTKRRPLYDALLRVAQTRLKVLQRDLDTIQQVLGTALRKEQDQLSNAEEALKQRLEQETDPTAALGLQIRLDTIQLQQATAQYRQQLNQLGEKVQLQEKRNGQLQQAADRLTSLVEKYKGGQGIVQRLLVAFERLQRLRLRYNDAPVRDLKTRLQTLTIQMFAVEDRLYQFDTQEQLRLTGVTAALQALPPEQREAEVEKIRRPLDEQRTALREQQQVLTELVQNSTTLLAAHRRYTRLLDDTYRFVLAKMFWIRDADPLRWHVVSDAMAGALYLFRRLNALVWVTLTAPHARLAGTIPLWIAVLAAALVLPWAAMWLRRRLRQSFTASITADTEQDAPLRLSSLVLLTTQAAVWPAYLALMAWMLAYILPQTLEYRDLSLALLQGLLLTALVLGIGLLGRVLLQPDGWAQRGLAYSPELCHFLRRLVTIGCVAVLVFLVPRHILLLAPGDVDLARDSMALARMCFDGFVGILLVLVGLAGWHHNPLMQTVLARSRQRDGLAWRLWPFGYILLLGGIIGIMVLDVLGHRYAAQSLWLRACESLFVVLLFRVLSTMLALRLVQGLVGFLFRPGSWLHQHYEGIEDAFERVFRGVYTIGDILLSLLVVGIILEIWGLSIFQFLVSPYGSLLLSRALLIALTAGLAVAVIQVSKVVTDYLLQPRTTHRGSTREASRKLKTLAPLVQTLVKVGVVFVSVLVILELIGISTGPFLAGLGIVGLAIGFASQSLIKDVINGLFILFEDSLSVGDIVILRGTGGQVEKVTLRAVTIRDLSGTVHVVPNGTLDMISNMTKDYSRYVLDVRIAYREDVDTVMDILREIDVGMRRDPAYQSDMLEPLEIWGLERFDESAVIIRARLKTRPIQQWRIGREFNRRMKKTFDERGIRIPFPQRTLHWGTSLDGEQTAFQQALESRQLGRQDD